MASFRTSHRIGLSLTAIIFFSLVLGYPWVRSEQSATAPDLRLREPALPRVGILTGTAGLECVNTGSSAEELHFTLREHGRVIEERVESVSPGFMNAILFQPGRSSSNNLTLRIARPENSIQGSESLLACWLLSYDTETGALTASMPVESENCICPDYACGDTDTESTAERENLTVTRIVPFNTDSFGTQTSPYDNVLVLQALSSDALSLHLTLYN